MLTVNSSPSSLPRSHPHPHHFRRTLPAHLSHHHRRRSLSHPAPSDPQDGKRPATALRPHAEDEDEEDEDDDEEDEIGVQAESRERLAAFVLKETSDESSDVEEDESGDEDNDSSSSASSSGSTPLLKPADSTITSVGKRSVTFHNASHLPTTSVLPPSAASPVVHRKLVKPSSRQHKVSPHHYSTHQSGNKTHAIRLHRRKAHTADSSAIVLPDDAQHTVPSPLASEPISSTAAIVPATAVLEVVEAVTEKSAPLIPPSSVSRYALLVAILRRSDGRDKMIRTAYFGSNHLRALVHTVYTQLSNNKRLLSMLSIPSTSAAAPSLIRILNIAALVCQGVDTHLGRLTEVLGAARQLLRFGRWVYDLQSLSEAWQEWKKCSTISNDSSSNEHRIERATAMLELINAFLSLLIDLMDDIEWLAEHRILPTQLSQPAGLTSAVLWLSTVCIDIPFTLSALRRSQDGKEGEWRSEVLSLLRYVGDVVYSGSLIGEHMGWVGECDGVRWRVGDSGALLSAFISLLKLSRSETLHRSVL